MLCAGTDFSFEEVQEVPNVLVALIILAVYTVAVLLFMLKPLHPIFRRVLPYVGAGTKRLLHCTGVALLTLLSEICVRSAQPAKNSKASVCRKCCC